jgi:hypothetical protein
MSCADPTSAECEPTNLDNIRTTGLLLVDLGCELGVNSVIVFVTSLASMDILTSNLAKESQLASMGLQLEMQLNDQIKAIASSSLDMPVFGSFLNCPNTSAGCTNLWENLNSAYTSSCFTDINGDTGSGVFNNNVPGDDTDTVTCDFILPSSYLNAGTMQDFLHSLSDGFLKEVNVNFN